jgi:P27 family predicted phage terminase small subunit
MGKRGPAPAPTALQLLKGEKKSRINTRGPKPEVKDRPPACPAWLSKEAKAVWRYHAKTLHKAELLTDWDRETFAVYCTAVVQHREACQVLAGAMVVTEDGVTASNLLVTGMHGNLVKNPILQVIRDTSQTIRVYAQQFGLTPSARSGIELPDAKGKNNEAAGRLLS